MKLSSDGKELFDYVAGAPFPVIDVNDPLAGYKIMWNQEQPPFSIDNVAARGEPVTPQGQMQVTMKPLVGLETTLKFGKAVTEVLVVRVECENATSRAYMLEADRIVLMTSDGKRVESLTASDNGFPVAPLVHQRLNQTT